MMGGVRNDSLDHPVGHPFDIDTAVERVADGEYRATLTDRWNTANKTPNGGYLTALMLRGLGAELAYDDPLTCTTTFLKPAVPGEAVIRVTTLRTGRTVATGEVLLMQADRPVVQLTGSFIDRTRAEGRTETFAEPPELPPVHECVDPAGTGMLVGPPIAERAEYRLAKPPGWASGKPTGSPYCEFWMRMQSGRPVDAYALAYLVDGYAPAVLELGVPTAATIQLTTYFHGVPADGWLACRHSTRFITDGYHDENFEVWDSAGTLVAESHQLATLG